ncbi:MAG TPA: DUF6531 domain-containing protein [Actinospica sp.]|nr:DUF6531 domain-containing protein [Actinospica sp.]
MAGTRSAPIAAAKSMTLAQRRAQVAQESKEKITPTKAGGKPAARPSADKVRAAADDARQTYLADQKKRRSSKALVSTTAATTASSSTTDAWGVPQTVMVTGPQGQYSWFSSGSEADNTAAGLPVNQVGGFGDGFAVPGETMTATAWIANSADLTDSNLVPENTQHEVHVVWQIDCNGVDDTYDEGQTVETSSSLYDNWFDIEDPAVSFSFSVSATQCAQGSAAGAIDNFYVNVEAYVTDNADGNVDGGGVDVGGYESLGVAWEETVGCECFTDATAVNRQEDFRGDPVNTATGAYSEAAKDVSVPGTGVPFSLDRSYSSNNTASGPLGTGWTLPWSASLAVASTGNVTYTDPGGAQFVFTDSGGTYSSDGSMHSTLAAVSGGGYTLTAPDHQVSVFNSSGQLTKQYDATGQGLTYAYSGGQVSTITDAGGRVVTLGYTGSLLKTVTLADGRTVSYGYTGGLLTSVTGVTGGTTGYTYNTAGLLASITDPLGNKLVQNTYNSAGQVISQIGATGATTGFSYSPVSGGGTETDTTMPGGGVWSDIYEGNVLSQTIDPLGKLITEYHDANLNEIDMVDQLGQSYTTGYTSSGQVSSSTYGPSYTYDTSGDISKAVLDNETTTLTYAAPGLPSKIVDGANGTQTFGYNSADEVTSATDAAGGTTDYGYDAYGDVNSVTDPMGNKTTAIYNSSGELVSLTQPLGNVAGANAATYTTTYTYNNAGQVLTITDPLSRVTTFGYDADGNETSVKDPTGATTKYGYDDAGDQISVTDPLGHESTSTYDGDGNLTSTTDAMGDKTTYKYDGKDELASKVSPLGNVSGATAAAFTTTYGYDVAGDQTSIVDPLHFKTTKTYDALGRVLTETDALNGTTTMTYDPAGNVSTVTDQVAAKTTYTYDGDNRLTAVQTPDGTTSYKLNGDGDVVSTTSPMGEVTTAGYNLDDEQTSVTDPRGNVSGATASAYTTQYGYDADGNHTTVTDPLNNVTTTAYDADGEQTSVTDALHHTTSYGYDGDGRQTSVKDALGDTSSTTYNSAGLKTVSKDDLGNETTYFYDLADRLTSEVSPLGNVSGATASAYTTQYGHDADGNQTTVTDPLKNVTTTAYNADDEAVSVTDPLKHVTATEYNADGNVIQVTYPNNATLVNSYFANQQLKESTDQDSRSTSYTYNPDGTRATETDPRGAETKWTYDSDARIAQVDAPQASASPTEITKYGYDAAGNQTTVTDPLGKITTTTYDADNNAVSVTDPLGRVTKTAYDADNEPTIVTDALTKTTTYGYDVLGDITSEKNADGNTTSYGYDANGDETSVTDPLGNKVQYGYDADGNQTVTTNARGGTVTNAYDADGHVTGTTYSDGTPSVSYLYNADGRPSSVTDATGTRSYTYNNDGDELTATGPGTTGFSYGYDSADQLQSRTDPAGHKTTYGYDADGNVNAETADGNAFAFSYDYAGNLLSTTYPSASGLVETRGYDADNRLASIAQTKSSSTLDSWQVTRDSDGEPSTVTSTRAGTAQAPQTDGYDSDGRLTSWCVGVAGKTGCPTGSTTTSYGYDAVGNLTSTTASSTTTANTYNIADELTKSVTGSTTVNYTYDADGNRTSDANATYSYNAADQLSSVSTSTTGEHLTYDAQGSLASVSGSTPPCGAVCPPIRTIATTGLTWDENGVQPQLVNEAFSSYTTDQANSSKSSNAAFYSGPGDTPLVDESSINAASATTTLDAHDWTGSVSDVFSTAGADQTAYSYDPFGNATSTAKPNTATQPFGYTGAPANPAEPSYLDLGAREYSSANESFTSRDPIGLRPATPSVSAYEYANDTPTTEIDPTGLSPWAPGNGWWAGASDGGLQHNFALSLVYEYEVSVHGASNVYADIPNGRSITGGQTLRVPTYWSSEAKPDLVVRGVQTQQGTGNAVWDVKPASAYGRSWSASVFKLAGYAKGLEAAGWGPTVLGGPIPILPLVTPYVDPAEAGVSGTMVVFNGSDWNKLGIPEVGPTEYTRDVAPLSATKGLIYYKLVRPDSKGQQSQDQALAQFAAMSARILGKQGALPVICVQTLTETPVTISLSAPDLARQHSLSPWLVGGVIVVGGVLIAGLVLAPEVEVPALVATGEVGGGAAVDSAGLLEELSPLDVSGMLQSDFGLAA